MTYGPNTPSVEAIIDRITVLTDEDWKGLDQAWDAARSNDQYAAWKAAEDASLASSRGDMLNAALRDARGAGWLEDWDTDWKSSCSYSHSAYCDRLLWAAGCPIWGAVMAIVTYDLATEDGPYTITQRDLLLAPWVSVWWL